MHDKSYCCKTVKEPTTKHPNKSTKHSSHMLSKETGKKNQDMSIHNCWCSIYRIVGQFRPTPWKEKGQQQGSKTQQLWRIKGFTFVRVANASNYSAGQHRSRFRRQQNECSSGKDMSQSDGWSGNVKMQHIWRKSEAMTQSCKWMRWWNTTEPLGKSTELDLFLLKPGDWSEKKKITLRIFF